MTQNNLSDKTNATAASEVKTRLGEAPSRRVGGQGGGSGALANCGMVVGKYGMRLITCARRRFPKPCCQLPPGLRPE